MKTIAVVSQKGGSGKTTLSVHLAACAVKAGKTVALIDIDPQENCFSWFQTRSSENELAATKAQAAELPQLLKKLKDAHADLVVIDTAPHSNDSAAAAVEMADFVLVPCRPSRFDLEAIISTMNIISLTKDPPPHAIVINGAPPVGKLAQEAREALEAQGYPVLKTVVSNRVAFNYAVTDGRSVHEYEPEGKATKEINALFHAISKIIEI